MTNPDNFNRYAYCLNNPLKYTDPSGYVYTGYVSYDWGAEHDRISTDLSSSRMDHYDQIYNRGKYSIDGGKYGMDPSGIAGGGAYYHWADGTFGMGTVEGGGFGNEYTPSQSAIERNGLIKVDGQWYGWITWVSDIKNLTNATFSSGINTTFQWGVHTAFANLTELAKIAAGKGGQINMNAKHNRAGFVPLDVGANFGAFQSANYKSDISVSVDQNKITVRATSSNTAVKEGNVTFNARASLVVDGNVTQTQNLENGVAIFELPSSGNISLTVTGGWTVYYDNGGAAVPVFHPLLWPFSLNFKDKFKTN